MSNAPLSASQAAYLLPLASSSQSKKPLVLKKVILPLIAICLLFSGSWKAIARTQLQFPGNRAVINVNFPSPINVPGNAPVGQVLATRDVPIPAAVAGKQFGGTSSASGNSLTWTGTKALASGFSNVYQTGIPGIGLRFKGRTLNGNSFLTGGFPPVPFTNHPTESTGQYWPSDTIIQIEIVKTSASMGSGAVSAGQYVSMKTDDGGEALSLSIPANGIRINTVTCQTPNVNVNLGNQNRSTLKGINTFTPSTNFDVALNSCSAGIKTIKYQVDALTPVLDANNAVVALNAGSTAKGVGVQLLDGTGAVYKLGTPTTFNGVTPGGGNYRIPLRARYIQTENVVNTGTANTSMTFTIFYE